MNVIKELNKLKCGKVIENADLSKYTTYRLKSTAKAIIVPENLRSLEKILEFIKDNNLKYKIIGNGSNLIFDNYYDGILVKLENINHLEINDTRIKVGSGYSLTKLAYKCSRLGLTGLEFATGIPGTVGGAVYMNAGAYNTDMGYIVSEIKVINPNLEIETIYNRDMNFHYRTSYLQSHKDYICIEATIILKHGNINTILDLVEERKKRRLMTQPLEYPSAGSVFRNPVGDYAGKLIEEVGYKGKRVGDAMVSMKHANFIINVGNATGEDIKKLIMEIQDKVKKEKNIELKVEQEFVE